MWSRTDRAMSAISDRLTDELLDTYVAWREHCAALAECYRCWLVAPLEDRAQRSVDCLSALDQEASAALAYQATCERLMRDLAHSAR
jgi:hypothetical protein